MTPGMPRPGLLRAPGAGRPELPRDPAQRPPRQPRRALHGVLLLDKPLGWTSNDALQKAKGLLRAEKGGHTGTLDPLATGLLPLCFGAATKWSQASLDADKRYRATLRLGQVTSTGDGEGQVTRERPVAVDLAAVQRACAALTGAVDQLPPMHSALKKDGRALYEYARDGVEVERTPRRVSIHAFTPLSLDGHTLVADVHCSKGTYVRTLAQDLGELLGCGAHLAALRRTACGTLDLAQAVTLDQLLAMDPPQRDALLLPPDVLLAHHPAIQLGADDAARFLAGQRRRGAWPDAPALRVYGPPLPDRPPDDPPVFLGTAHVRAGELIAERLLSPLEVQALAPATPGTAP